MEKHEIEILIFSIAIISMVLIAFSISIYLVFINKQRKHELKISKMQREHLQSQLEIKELTLSQVSEELHDNIGQAITFARMNLGSIVKTTTPDTNDKINNANEILKNALNDLRSLSRSMLGEKIAEIGTEASLRNQIKYIADSGLFSVAIESEGEIFLLGSQREIFAFRIVQEALNNIVKHSGANKILIRFVYKAEKLIISIEDNGIGFDPQKIQSAQSGNGLKNMMNRAALLDGNLTFTHTHTGLCMKLEIPKK